MPSDFQVLPESVEIKQATGGRGVPRVVAEGHVVDEESGEHRNRLLGDGSFAAAALFLPLVLTVLRCGCSWIRNVETGAGPLLGGFVILRPAAVDERGPPAVRGGVDVTNFGALQASTERGPGVAGVVGGDEGVVVEGEHDERAARMLAVNRDVGDVHVVEADVGGGKGFAAVVADLHTFAFGADDQLLRILLVDDHRVDDPVARSHAAKIFFVDGLPEATGGAGVEDVRVRGIHANELRAAENVGNALVLHPIRCRRSGCGKCRSRRPHGRFRSCWDRR